MDRRCNVCLRDNLIPTGGTDVLPSWEPSMLHEFKTSVMCTCGSAVFGVKEETLGTLSLCFSTQGGGYLVSCMLPTQNITLRRFTDPHTSLGVPGPHTLVDSPASPDVRKLGTRILLPPALLSKQQDSPQLPQWVVNPFRTTQAHQTRSVLFT